MNEVEASQRSGLARTALGWRSLLQPRWWQGPMVTDGDACVTSPPQEAIQQLDAG